MEKLIQTEPNNTRVGIITAMVIDLVDGQLCMFCIYQIIDVSYVHCTS